MVLKVEIKAVLNAAKFYSSSTSFIEEHEVESLLKAAEEARKQLDICPKCNKNNVYNRWIEEFKNLRRTCMSCNYRWYEKR